jgi:hypothetical protein
MSVIAVAHDGALRFDPVARLPLKNPPPLRSLDLSSHKKPAIDEAAATRPVAQDNVKQILFDSELQTLRLLLRPGRVRQRNNKPNQNFVKLLARPPLALMRCLEAQAIGARCVRRVAHGSVGGGDSGVVKVGAASAGLGAVSVYLIAPSRWVAEAAAAGVR